MQAKHTEQLGNVLSPFRQQITDFKRRVEEVYTTDAKDRASLLNEVRNLQQASERVNREAEHLARALKGDTRVQGNWGELVLERVLEDSGLRARSRVFPANVVSQRRRRPQAAGCRHSTTRQQGRRHRRQGVARGLRGGPRGG